MSAPVSAAGAADITGGIRQNPVIAAVRNPGDLEASVNSDVKTIFLLNADIFNLKDIVAKALASSKKVLVHLDFIEGLGRDKKAVNYIGAEIKPHGIITTHSSHIRFAKEAGLFTVQRFFVVDSISFESGIRSVESNKPDLVEIMPAVMPSVIARFCALSPVPVIAGGLVSCREDIDAVLAAGAIGVSTGKRELWTDLK